MTGTRIQSDTIESMVLNALRLVSNEVFEARPDLADKSLVTLRLQIEASQADYLSAIFVEAIATATSEALNDLAK